MRTFAILVVLAFAAVPAALAEDTPDSGTTERPLQATAGRDRYLGLRPALRRRRECLRPLRLEARERVRGRQGERREAVPRRERRRVVRDHARRQDVRAVLRQRQERTQRLRQMRLPEVDNARPGTARRDDLRGEDVQEGAHVARRRGLHREVRQPDERVRQMRLEDRARPAVGAFAKGGRGPPGAPPF